MKRILALIAIVALLLVGLWLAMHQAPAPPTSVGEPGVPQAAQGAAPTATVEAPAAEPERGKVEAATPAPGAATADAPAVALAELHGRCVLAGGAPAAGARLELGGWEANSERVQKFGRPKSWNAQHTECDADGRFSIRFDPPRAYQFTLEASFPGCVKANWRWAEIEPAANLDLGQIELPRGGAVAGRVVDARGNPTHDDWQVYADGSAIAGGKGGDSSRGFAQADKVTGQFRIEDLPPGRVELSAQSEMANWIKGTVVEVRAGETVEADIQYTGPDNSRRITVRVSAKPFHSFGREIASIELLAPGKEPRKAQMIQHSASSWSFDDLEPGAYSVVIEDPKFKPWRQDGVRPGEAVSAKLEGASGVSLAVVDAATRAAVEHYALRVRFEHVRFSPNTVELFDASAEPPPAGLVAGLLPVPQTLIVVAQGYAPCELALEGLQAGEIRPLSAELRKGTMLVARLLQADGKTPIAGSKVTLEPSRANDLDKRTRVRLGDRSDQRDEVTDADGRARFAAVAAGSYELRSEMRPWLAAELHELEIRADDTERAVDLVLPPNGWLVGRVLGFDSAPVEGCSLIVLPLDLSDQERGVLSARLSLDQEHVWNPIAADGSFRAGPLPARKCSVTFQYPQVTFREGSRGGFSSPGASIAFGEVEIPAEGELRRDFDLRDRLPGQVEADVRVDGAPASAARVDILPQPGGQSTSIALDAQGHGTSAPVAAGDVRFILYGPDGSWSWTPPGAWKVASGQTLHVQWDVQLSSGSLQLVEADSGNPLVEKQVMIAPDSDEFGGWIQRTTDKQGKFDLRLVPAAYRVQFLFEFGADGKRTQSPYLTGRFDWTAGGPSAAVLKIAKKP